MFNWKKINELLLHHQYDHQIELTDEGILLWSKIYSLSGYKFQKMKKYITENFKKDFIEFSKASYSVPILFTLKLNGNLWFYVDYWKLNIITKCNCYFILLINEMLMWVLGCKYMIYINIIAVFNKLQMHSDSKNFIIFITSLSAFKYKVLFFDFINESASYQQYINKVLFNFFNHFIQVYFDDILIYSKTYKKHVNHVYLILSRL